MDGRGIPLWKKRRGLVSGKPGKGITFECKFKNIYNKKKQGNHFSNKQKNLCVCVYICIYTYIAIIIIVVRNII